MRIAHFAQSLRLEEGGVAKAVIDLCACLRAGGHECAVATHAIDDAARAALGTARVEVLPPLAGPLRLLTSAARATARRVLEWGEAAHFHGAWTLSHTGLGAWCRTRGVAYVVSPHGMLDDFTVRRGWAHKQVYLALAGSRFLRGAGAVHCTARAELAQSSRFFPRELGVVAPLPMDLTPFDREPDGSLALEAFPALRRHAHRVLFLARLHKKKRPDLVVRSVALLRGEGLDALCVIAGTGGEEERLRSLAAELGVADATLFTGFVGGKLKTSLLAACEVSALPSSQENFGYSMFESLAAGTPVVTTGLVDTWEEIESSGGGLAVEQTSGAFALAMGGLLRDAPRREAMGRSGRAWVMRTLAPDATRAALERVYNAALSRGGRATRR